MAESFNLYVQDGFKEEGDGSKDKPFDNISDALKKAKAGDKIYIAKGTYSGGFEVSPDIDLIGESRDSVFIQGSITASTGVSFKNISVVGGSKAISLKTNAKVTVTKCIIKEANIGIDVPPGNGKLVVENSKILKNRKGFYIQAGNQFQLTDSYVYDNKEEGIDLRNNNDGFIKDNEIYENGESGIEIILGKTEMVISGNLIKNNKASGIATQYYDSYGDKGELVVKDNTIKGNSHYGIKCGIPQGDGPSKAYWTKSIDVEKNEFDNNDSGNIEKRCKILTSEEIAELEKIEEEERIKMELAKKEKERQMIEDKKTEEEKRKDSELKKQEELNDAIRQIEKKELDILGEFTKLESGITEKLNSLQTRNKFVYFLLGPDTNKMTDIETDLGSSKSELLKLEELVERAPADDLREKIKVKMSSLEQSIALSEQTLNEIKKNSNFWTRIKNLFT